MIRSDLTPLVREYKPTDLLPYIQAPAGEKEIELRSLDIHVVVTGLYSETTQTMTFYNPNQRDLEGELCFPLPDGAAVCGYGLDMDGQMIDGVIVPKAQARKILEKEIRKGVDPGLVEHVQGNLYRTRIYPIPARGSRTVRLSYISNLAVQDRDASYHLPLAHAGGIGRVSLKVEVVQSPVRPKISGLGNLTMSQWDDRWVAEAVLDTTAAVDDLLVRLPRLPEQLVNVERQDGETFFSFSSSLSPVRSRQWQAKRIGIAWDASGSRAGHPGMKKEFFLISSLFKSCGVERADLLVFRNTVEPEITSFDSASSLISYLETIPYDGGTDLAALDFNRFDQAVEACFLFSDGINSGGKGITDQGKQPVITVNSSTQHNAELMQFIASRSGGVYVNLQNTGTGHAVSALCTMDDKPRLAEKTGCEDVFMETDSGRLSIVGRLTEDRATIRLTGQGVPEDAVTISADRACRSGNIARAWAGCKVRQLALVDDRSEEIVTLGRRFALVTPGTSLLVLESLAQYLEYNIAPPESLPLVRKEFFKQKGEQKLVEEKQLKLHLDQVVSWWDGRVEWWQRDFKSSYQKQLKIMEEKRRGRQHGMHAPSSPENIRRHQRRARLHPARSVRQRLSVTPGFDASVMDEIMAEPAECCESLEVAYAADSSNPEASRSAVAAISIQGWSPDTPYLSAIRAADVGSMYSVYLLQRSDYAKSPSFFLDCGDYFFKQGQEELAVRIISNLEELQLGDVALLRMYAWRLQQAGRLNMAIKVFERIRTMRDDEPQSHRDLALALSDRWQEEKKEADAVRAMNLLYDVIVRSWDRFPEIELIALMELNRLIHAAAQAGIAAPDRIDKRLVRNLDLDIRISMSWDADLTDVDLHVFEPDGGHAYYGHSRTLIGGLVSRDFTQGYGPEEYILHRAMPGTYVIKAHYFGSHQQTLCGPCTVTATVFTNFGRADEQKQVLTLRLDKASDQELVGEITINGKLWTGEGEQKLAQGNMPARFSSLTKDLSMEEARDLVGLPDDSQGDGKTLLVYPISDRSKVELHFAPGLHAVRHVMDGCTLDIL